MHIYINVYIYIYLFNTYIYIYSYMYIYGYLLYIFLKNVNVRNETILTLLQHLPMCYVKIGCLLSLFKRKTEHKM